MQPLERPAVGQLGSPALREMAESIPEIDHYELDGIPLFHLPAAGATILTLAFGVGRAHESIQQAGITHLFEHLVLTGINRALDHSNGTTEPFRVTFTVRGSPADASKFLRDVCDQIANPRYSRMQEEANVLRAEADLRPDERSIPGKLDHFRVGYQGLGSIELPEFFLRRLDEKVMRAWVAKHFVAGNAAIWILGPLPDDLYIALEAGPATPLPAYTDIPFFETPTFMHDDIGGVGASFVAERGTALQVALRTVQQRLTKALRVDRGLGYVVDSGYRPVHRDRAVAMVYASCLPHNVADVQRVMLETIDDVANRGSSDDEIADFFVTFVRDATDPMAAPYRLDTQAADMLMGLPPKPLATRIDEMWRIQPESTAAAFRAARETILLLLPRNAIVSKNRVWKPYPTPTVESLGNGMTFEWIQRKGGWFEKGKPPRLFVGGEGLYMDTPIGRYFHVRWSNCVAVVHSGEDRLVINRDGTSFMVSPEEWKSGYNAIALVDRHAPADVVVR